MKIKKIIIRTIAALLVIFILAFIIITGPFWWKYWVTYPRLEKERAELWSKYKEPQKFIELNEYKGEFHLHSYWSHDSRGKLNEILPAAKKAGYSFLFFSDHPHSKLDTFPRSYHGVYDGVIFEPGTESSHGFMVTPMDSVVLDWSKGDSAVIHDVVKNNGLVIYVHTEKPHHWDNPDYQAMEIYNIHTDFLDGNDGLLSLALNSFINKKKYHHWIFREIYDEQTEILSNWDKLNKHRRIVGVAAVDAHNNNNIRARYLDNGKVEWVGPNAETLEIVEPGLKEKILLGEPDSTGWAFKWELDPYFISFNYVANHVFSDTLTNFGIKDNLVAGHEFISFQSLAKADGFQYFAVDSSDNVNAILGDSISAKSVAKLKAVSPFPVQFQLVKDGKVIDTVDNVYEYEFDPNDHAGNYRIVAKVFLDDAWVSWVFTNPIYIY
ncbi:hypothetical protein MNBD_IGNAVI01-2444 [hydrothermal vent metagenome]|uniref:Polymerase/histidinol phosphatase N-terminal domain-containing protein n=1 Tax=hydrothermal vent metagenome TaxID=652676 RepID=A0A3B1BT12_9ZZZZ